MPLQDDLARLNSWVRVHGVGGAMARARNAALYRLHVACDRRFDRRWGIETVDMMGRQELGLSPIEHDTNELYGPTPSLLMPALTSLVAPRLRPATTFFDVGAGKAGMMINASAHGFARIVGVEYYDPIAQIGRQNLRTALGEEADATLVTADGSTFAPPPGDVFLMFYNSFRGETFDVFLDTLERSLVAEPRVMDFVYVNPHCKDVMDANPRWHRRAFAPWAHAMITALSPHPILAWRAKI